MNITGFFNYKGLTIMQHIDVDKQFKKLLTQIKPKKILEIGTSAGGLTLMIRDILDEIGLPNTTIQTYDINTPKYLLEHIKNGVNINVNVRSVFNHNYDNLLNASEVINYISSDGLTLVLCDGGSKINEFRLLSQFLKQGDIIMAHDYAPNQEYFEKYVNGKIWNWLEIQDKDIQESCSKHNLHPYMENELRDVVWVGKIKK